MTEARLRVVILQEYVPEYRRRFFELLIERARAEDIEVVVGAGAPHLEQRSRGDAARPSWIVGLPQKEIRVAGRRVTFRRSNALVAGADLIVFEQARRNVDAYRHLLTARSQRRRVALWGHGRDYVKHASSMETRLQSWLTNRADWFFAYTQGGADSVAAAGFSRSSITVVQNSLDTTGTQQDIEACGADDIQAFRHEHGLGEKIALFIGALDQSKRLDFLRQAWAQCRQIDPDVQLAIAGNGPLSAEVRDWAQEPSGVVYLGHLQGRRKALAMASSLVIANPGRVGLVAVDSFACRLPLITTNWNRHAPEYEYLRNGVNAVIAPNTVAGYAAALSSTIADHELREHLAAGCAESAEHITIEHMADNFLSGIRAGIVRRPDAR